MDIKLQMVQMKDADFLCTLMNNDSIMTALDEVPTTLAVWSESINEWNQDADEENYIIFDGTMPISWIGINGLSSQDHKAYIKMLALIPKHQRQGIGQFVLKNILESLKSRHYKAVALYTNQNNLQAQHCYLKCSFKIVKVSTQKMANGKTRERYKMEIEL